MKQWGCERVKASSYCSIDNYLEACTRLGKSLDKEYKGSLNLCFPRELSRRRAVFVFTREGAE